ncbi:uncharacterized protein LOC106644842 [Copidosoma floridanum]|uniref:uncharacterized protein LOC106644842 n=1 Tax=Copidosoma floridanum TaxID=29053 RepID=UPI0006C95263|nr:uncharacterized protein LOC106644842 [Copidosoma floridanum]XP_014216011.1 uncharacterized protein LOC106644842 [Copidosoma floridanum]XP_014216012.1 uncharacterized protein LOC106644842 [Copidosoma floridanum]
MSFLDQQPYTNGKHKHVFEKVQEKEEDIERSCDSFVENLESLWRRPTLNEWTFTFLLFLLSSSIFFGKLFLSHDFLHSLDIDTDKINKSIPMYKDIADKTIIEPLHKYSWLIKAVISGFATTGLSWVILYQDSHVPGVNPPSPFSPSKKRNSKESPILEFNYLVGASIGFLMFLYMCL